MQEKGLLIHYDYCTGCHSCEIACQQEHDFPVGHYGVYVTEHIMETDKGVRINYYPLITDMCDLCPGRAAEDMPPACVKHCQAQSMFFGDLDELLTIQKNLPKSMLYRV